MRSLNAASAGFSGDLGSSRGSSLRRSSRTCFSCGTAVILFCLCHSYTQGLAGGWCGLTVPPSMSPTLALDPSTLPSDQDKGASHLPPHILPLHHILVRTKAAPPYLPLLGAEGLRLPPPPHQRPLSPSSPSPGRRCGTPLPRRTAPPRCRAPRSTASTSTCPPAAPRPRPAPPPGCGPAGPSAAAPCPRPVQRLREEWWGGGVGWDDAHRQQLHALAQCIGRVSQGGKVRRRSRSHGQGGCGEDCGNRQGSLGGGQGCATWAVAM